MAMRHEIFMAGVEGGAVGMIRNSTGMIGHGPMIPDCSFMNHAGRQTYIRLEAIGIIYHIVLRASLVPAVFTFSK
jgi:hypothetical protein